MLSLGKSTQFKDVLSFIHKSILKLDKHKIKEVFDFKDNGYVHLVGKPYVLKIEDAKRSNVSFEDNLITIRKTKKQEAKSIFYK